MTVAQAYQQARILWPWPDHIAFATVIVAEKTCKVGYCIRGSQSPARVFYGPTFEECFAQAGAA